MGISTDHRLTDQGPDEASPAEDWVFPWAQYVQPHGDGAVVAVLPDTWESDACAIS